MASTEDVAKKLYQFITESDFNQEDHLFDLSPKILLDKLQTLSEHCRVGIEDASSLVEMYVTHPF